MPASRRITRPLDRRNCSRIPCSKPIRVYTGSRTRFSSFTLMSADMSIDGVFLATDILLDVGERLDLEFSVPGRPSPIRRGGRVVRAETGNGSGIAVHLDE